MRIDTSSNMLPTLHTLEEVAAYLHKKPETVRKLCKRIGLNPVRSRPTLLFTESDVGQLLEASRQCSNAGSFPLRPVRRSGVSVVAPTRTTATVLTQLRALHQSDKPRKYSRNSNETS